MDTPPTRLQHGLARVLDPIVATVAVLVVRAAVGEDAGACPERTPTVTELYSPRPATRLVANDWSTLATSLKQTWGGARGARQPAA